jgi:hypothetical protein
MSDTFKTIETQEELDAIIEKRLKREREVTTKRFEGWISPEDHQKAIDSANKALDDYKEAHKGDEQTIADLTAKNKAYETASLKSRIAHEVGLSYDWISRISGEDEDSIRADAESLKKLVGTGAPLPTKNTESGENLDPAKTALRSVLSGIKTD